MATNFEDIMTCAVCLDFYEEPKILTCKNGSHVFCKKCLKSLVTENNSISCPKCRENHQIPDGDVDNLTTDLNMQEMIATCLCADCRTFDKFCKPCDKCGVRSCHVCICGHDDGEKCELLGTMRRVTRQLPTPPQKEAMNQLLEDWGSFREKNSKERQETDERMTVLIESLQQKRRDILQVFDEYDKYASERIEWLQQSEHEKIADLLQMNRNNINDMTQTAVKQALDTVRKHVDTMSKKGAMLSEVIPDNLCTVYTERLQREIRHFGNQITRRKAGKDMDVDLVFRERNCTVRTESDDAWSSTPLVGGTIHVYRHIGGLYQFNVMDENDEDKILKTFRWNNRRPQTGEPTMARYLWTSVPWHLKTDDKEEEYSTLISVKDRRCAFQNVLEHAYFMDKE